MARWKKPDPALVTAFRAALEPYTGIEQRQMFGCPSAFVDGHLFACVHEDRLVVRIPSRAAASPFAPMGRAMKEYAALEGALDLPEREFDDLIAEALRHGRGLPPKGQTSGRKEAPVASRRRAGAARKAPS